MQPVISLNFTYSTKIQEHIVLWEGRDPEVSYPDIFKILNCVKLNGYIFEGISHLMLT
uniref:Uncharacterized protein n=1 Tax=Tetranychus urticae TaxID=32264 RepID=T1KB03_TETUR